MTAARCRQWQLSANISFLFTELPFLDRIDAAARAGFAAVECLFPYDHPPAVLAARLRNAGVELALFNLAAGNWAGGERGLAVLPDREAAFRQSIESAADFAAATGCKRLHMMAGIPSDAAPTAVIESLYLERLGAAADALALEHVDVMIEPISRRAMPGYYLRDTRQALQIIGKLARPNLRLQLDLFHCQATEGDLVRTIDEVLPLIGHVQIAGCPDRHEPDEGEVNYAFVFRRLSTLGYSGWVGCEYHPRGRTGDGLGWIDALVPGSIS